MKKFVLLFLTLILLTGCTNDIEYNFKKDTIQSNINLQFNNEEFISYQSKITNEYNLATNQQINDAVKSMIDTNYPLSIDSNSITEYYRKDSYQLKNNNHVISYSYIFNYDNFINNYYLNKCFDFFSITNIDNGYYIKISGNYKCSYPNTKLKIKSDYKIISSTNDNIENDTYIWKIKEKNNNITFSLIKNYSKTSSFPTYKIVIGVVLLLCSAIIIFIIKKTIRN